MTRRKMLGLLAGSLPLLRAGPALVAQSNPPRSRLGICTNSYDFHWRAARQHHPQARFADPLDFLEYCHGLGAAGVQVSLSTQDPGYAARFRAKLEACQMFYESTLSLPQAESEVARFAAQLDVAKAAGAAVVRTALLGGRRYETFASAADFRRFAERSWRSLTLAEPVVRQRGLRLAVENHKDWRVPEFLDLLKRLGSESVGVCLDTGNNLALLEDPLVVVEALAPFAFSTHLKDMAVRMYEDGFLLSEVPLGEGILDLKRIVAIIRQANPRIHFNLEMITRDPLKIPCLTPKYWATMETVPAPQLAAALRQARQHARSLPTVGTLDLEQQLRREDDNVRQCLAYAQTQLGL